MSKTNAISIMCLSFCITSVFLTGCAGTMHTRSQPQGTFFGKPVYEAVAEDFRVTFYGCNGGFNWLSNYNMLKPFSFPLDFLLDTVFLPADLISWGMGYSKYTTIPQSKKKETEENVKE